MTGLREISWTHEMREAVRRLPIFAGLDDQAFDHLCAESTLFAVDARADVLSRDSAPDGFTFLVAGSWTMRSYVPGTRDPVVWQDTRPGSWHGGVEAIDAIAPAEVQTDVPSHLVFVPRAVMLALVRTNPITARTLLRGIHGGAELLWTANSDHGPAHRTLSRVCA